MQIREIEKEGGRDKVRHVEKQTKGEEKKREKLWNQETDENISRTEQ